jgi:hypothetical protein
MMSDKHKTQKILTQLFLLIYTPENEKRETYKDTMKQISFELADAYEYDYDCVLNHQKKDFFISLVSGQIYGYPPYNSQTISFSWHNDGQWEYLESYDYPDNKLYSFDDFMSFYNDYILDYEGVLIPYRLRD